MNLPRSIPLVLIALAFGSAADATRAAAPKRPPPESDLASIETRRSVVELAASLAKVEAPESLADKDLTQPFNPPGFGLDGRPIVDVATPGPVRAFGDREILASLAARVLPKGTLSLGSQSLLIFGKKNLRVGDRITVNFEGRDYNLELVAFDRTNFTLRLNKEEITRPIKPGKTP